MLVWTTSGWKNILGFQGSEMSVCSLEIGTAKNKHIDGGALSEVDDI